VLFLAFYWMSSERQSRHACLTISENIIRSASNLQSNSYPQKQRHWLQRVPPSIYRLEMQKCINKYSSNSRVLILKGPNIRLSQDLVLRFKKILKYLPETEKTVALVNNVRVEAFPSFHCSAARGYTDSHGNVTGDMISLLQ
jgi:hypothetical protein